MFASNKQVDLLRNTNKQTILKRLKNNLGGLNMKTTYLFITMMLVLSLASCTSSDNDLSNENSFFESVKSTYGIETVTYSVSNTGLDVVNVPSVTLAEIQGVLEALRQNSNKQNNCKVEIAHDADFGGKNEVNKRVIMGSEYTALTRTGSFLENFLLRVELKFSTENNLVSYYGTDYMYNSELFYWRANGLSLYPVKNSNGCTYEFESESFLYFRIADEGNCLAKVAVVFKGNYNFNSESGTYSFQLQKHSK